MTICEDGGCSDTLKALKLYATRLQSVDRAEGNRFFDMGLAG